MDVKRVALAQKCTRGLNLCVRHLHPTSPKTAMYRITSVILPTNKFYKNNLSITELLHEDIDGQTDKRDEANRCLNSSLHWECAEKNSSCKSQVQCHYREDQPVSSASSDNNTELINALFWKNCRNFSAEARDEIIVHCLLKRRRSVLLAHFWPLTIGLLARHEMSKAQNMCRKEDQWESP
jgi:hypothetical protein